MYVRTAPASRWDMPEEANKITEDIWQRAKINNVTCNRWEWFWNSIVQFGTEKTNRWHHAHEDPKYRCLHYRWDRMLFRVASFSKACIIHPGTLGSIYATLRLTIGNMRRSNGMKSWITLLKRAVALLVASAGTVMLLSTPKSKKSFLTSFPRVPPIMDLLGHHMVQRVHRNRVGLISLPQRKRQRKLKTCMIFLTL